MLETNEFLSYQPYLELNNNYQSYVPIEHNIIRDIVWEVYEVDDFDLGKTVALPDVCADIMTCLIRMIMHIVFLWEVLYRFNK